MLKKQFSSGLPVLLSSPSPPPPLQTLRGSSNPFPSHFVNKQDCKKVRLDIISLKVETNAALQCPRVYKTSTIFRHKGIFPRVALYLIIETERDTLALIQRDGANGCRYACNNPFQADTESM